MKEGLPRGQQARKEEAKVEVKVEGEE